MAKAFGIGAGPAALGLALALWLGGSAAGQGTHPDLAGVWRLDQPAPQALRTLDGQAPPLKPQAAALYRQRVADRKAGRNQPEGFAACTPPGTPKIMLMDRPFMILQTARKITFVHEYEHILRHVYLDEPLPLGEDTDPTYGGAAVGHWDGDALVVRTGAMNDKTDLDPSGLPHSDALTVTERLSLARGGQILEDRITVDDPKTFTRPWSFGLRFKRSPGVQLQEHNCVEALLPH